jgi:hypothetical protein
MRPHNGTLILVLGILSLVICHPVGIAAWVMGSSDLKEMDAGRMDPTGRGLTQAGKVCGIIGTMIMAAALLLLLFFMAIAMVAGVAGHH